MIPFKGGASAKSRLRYASGGSAGLSAELRHQLALAFLLDTVAAVNTVDDVGRIVIVSSDPRVASALPCVVMVEDPGAGLNAAITAGIEWAARLGSLYRPVAVLTGDLPCLKPNDLAVTLRLAQEHPKCMVPDRDGSGTTLISALPGIEVTPHFGVESSQLHRLAGHRVLPILTDSTIRQDVDSTEDLLWALKRGVGPSTEVAIRGVNFWPPLDGATDIGLALPRSIPV